MSKGNVYKRKGVISVNDIQFKELVKICVDKLKDETIFELIENDTEYQKTAEKEGIAEKAIHIL